MNTAYEWPADTQYICIVFHSMCCFHFLFNYHRAVSNSIPLLDVAHIQGVVEPAHDILSDLGDLKHLGEFLKTERHIEKEDDEEKRMCQQTK